MPKKSSMHTIFLVISHVLAVPASLMLLGTSCMLLIFQPNVSLRCCGSSVPVVLFMRFTVLVDYVSWVPRKDMQIIYLLKSLISVNDLKMLIFMIMDNFSFLRIHRSLKSQRSPQTSRNLSSLQTAFTHRSHTLQYPIRVHIVSISQL